MNINQFFELLEHTQEATLSWPTGVSLHLTDYQTKKLGEYLRIGTKTFTLYTEAIQSVQQLRNNDYQLTLADKQTMFVSFGPDEAGLTHFIQRLNRAVKIHIHYASYTKIKIDTPHFAWVCPVSGALMIASENTCLVLGQISDFELYDHNGLWDYYHLLMLNGLEIDIGLWGNDTAAARMATGLFNEPDAYESAAKYY